MDTDYRLHPNRTKRRKLEYQFTRKHHQRGAALEWGQWTEDLTPDEEFAVFDLADEYQFEVEPGGPMFGVLPLGNSRLRILGSRGEQLAFFWNPPNGGPWHGFPVNLLEDRDHVPPPELRTKMIESGVITEIRMRRLLKGRRA